MSDDPINEIVNVVDLFGTAPNHWKLRDEAMADEGLPKLPEGSPAYEYTGGTVVYGKAEVRQAQREAYEAGRAAGSDLDSAKDAMQRVERRIHDMWQDADAEWGDACGGPDAYEIFAYKLMSAIQAEFAGITSPQPPKENR